jgi:hypothetical protein
MAIKIIHGPTAETLEGRFSHEWKHVAGLDVLVQPCVWCASGAPCGWATYWEARRAERGDVIVTPLTGGPNAPGR